jgi:hypothetical protein
MSIYWKQGLLLGGLYCIISLVLAAIDTFESYFTDFILSLLLTIFLIPLNFVKPIKWLDKLMKKLPITTTFLTFVGWVPYLSVLVFFVATIYGFTVVFNGYVTIDGLVLNLITPLSILTIVKTACIIFSFIMAAFLVFVYKKTVAGCLNEKFKLVGGDSCNMPVVEEAYAEHAKKMYECKKESVERKAKEKKAKTEKKESKKESKKVVKTESDKKKTTLKATKKKTTSKKTTLSGKTKEKNA